MNCIRREIIKEKDYKRKMERFLHRRATELGNARDFGLFAGARDLRGQETLHLLTSRAG